MDLDVVLADPNVVYVGGATSGVWKSTDAGTTWRPIFDEQETSAIGAVRVFQPNPNIVWVGTGEGKPRYGSGVGTGVYKSLDAGRTWRRLGLTASERIQRIVLHPTDPEIAYVAAVGPQWSPGGERGVYRTRDGGESWQRVLSNGDHTGAADLVMDPANPNKLIAALWEFKRVPWFVESGGPGSGLFVSEDGGESWQQLTPEDGIPGGVLGRIGLAIAPGKPSVVYAVFEAETSGLYRSEDGGLTWALASDDPDHFGAVTRAWYGQNLTVDPANENRLYFGTTELKVSEDGGRTFETLIGWRSTIHVDFHPTWVDPRDSQHLITGNDGGLAISHSGGKTWRFVENLPFAQYYQISVDDETPYNVYGNVQDNSDFRTPSSVWTDGGILSQHSQILQGGEQGLVFPVPGDARYVYTADQQGSLHIEDTLTNMATDLMPAHDDPSVKLRFNIHAGQALDPFEPDAIYLGSQFVHKSGDRGRTWQRISPDLTSNDPAKQEQWRIGGSGGLTLEAAGGENHTTIVAIFPSPARQGLIWIGTDDGNVQLTQDGGASWQDVGAGISGPRPGYWVNHVEPSRTNPAEAFVVIDDHRRGDFTPYVFKTSDYGQSWTRLEMPEVTGNAYVLVQDPVEPNLLFLGVEFGLWVSLDGGRNWRKWTHGVPTCSVRSLVIHPRDGDLVIGTFGRGIFIVDDLRPLRAVAADPGLLGQAGHLFEVAPVIQYWVGQPSGARDAGDTPFVGENRPYGAIMTYTGSPDADASADQARIEIHDHAGNLVAALDGPNQPGLNRVVWNLRHDCDLAGWGWPNRARPLTGPDVVPGSYQVRLSIGERTSVGSVEVLPDPRMNISTADRREKLNLLNQALGRLAAVRSLEQSLTTVIEALAVASDRIEASRHGPRQDLLVEINRLRGESLELRNRLRHVVPQALGHPVTTLVKEKTGSTYGFTAVFAGVYGALRQSWDAPTEAQRAFLRQAEERFQTTRDEIDRLLREDVPSLETALRDAGIGIIPSVEPAA
jgi:photosystem II stability/assembly factor-like uncharacterized protein